jgi:hypothetical protein
VFENVPAGLYQIRVKDELANNSIMDTLVNLINPSPIVLTVNFANASCTTPGSAQVQVSGGRIPYKYELDDNDTWTSILNGATISDINVGAHVLTLRDANNCLSNPVQGQVVSSIAQIDGALVKTDVSSINGSDGRIRLSGISGGTSLAYEFRIEGVEAQLGTVVCRPFSSTMSNLKAGTYTVHVRNVGTYCEKLLGTVTILQPGTATNNASITTGYVYGVEYGIMVKGYINQFVQVLDCNGKIIYSGYLDLDEQYIPVQNKSVYVVQVADKSMKVLVK